MKIDLSDMILEHLVDELVEILAGLGEEQPDLSVVKKLRNPPPTSPFNEMTDTLASKLDPENLQKLREI